MHTLENRLKQKPIFDELLALQEVEEHLYGDSALSEELALEVYSLARKIVYSEFRFRDDKEDIVSECVLAAFRAIKTNYDPDRSYRLHSYLSRVISNRAIDICRRKHAVLIGDEVLELQEDEYPGMEASLRYIGLQHECQELLIQRFRDHDPDDIADAFGIVYDIEIPKSLRGGKRGAIAQIQRFTHLPRSEAMCMYYSTHFILRLGILDMLRYAEVEWYLRPKQENLMTLKPEFAVAYAVNDINIALRLLNGMTLEL